MTEVVKPKFSNRTIVSGGKQYTIKKNISKLNLPNNSTTYDMRDYSYVGTTSNNNLNSQTIASNSKEYEYNGDTQSSLNLEKSNNINPTSQMMIKQSNPNISFISSLIGIGEGKNGEGIFSDNPNPIGIGIYDLPEGKLSRTVEKEKQYTGEDKISFLPDDAHSHKYTHSTGFFAEDGTYLGRLDDTGLYYDAVNNKYYRYDEETGALKPLSPFDEENREFGQYGGDQEAFRDNFDELINDPIIWEEMQKYFPVESFASEEEAMQFYEEYFNSIRNTGCGYVSATNGIFKQYIGREEEFEEKFGFPMYTVDEDTGEVDYNYEYLELQYFNYRDAEKLKKNYDAGNAVYDPEKGTFVTNGGKKILSGTDVLDEYKAKDFYKQYGIDTEVHNRVLANGGSDNNVNNQLQKYFDSYDTVVIGTQGYDLYDMDGNLVVEGGGAHDMEIVGFTDAGQPIVSSWGEKYVLDTDGSLGGNNEYWTWPALNLVCVNYEDNVYHVSDDPSVLYQ